MMGVALHIYVRGYLNIEVAMPSKGMFLTPRCDTKMKDLFFTLLHYIYISPNQSFERYKEVREPNHDHFKRLQDSLASWKSNKGFKNS